MQLDNTFAKFVNKHTQKKSNLKKHLLSSKCLDKDIKCRKCNVIHQKKKIHNHSCKPSMQWVPPHLCICGEMVVNLKHCCKSIKKVYAKFSFKEDYYIALDFTNIKTDFCLHTVYEFANELLRKNNIFMIRFACALLVAYKYLFRTSKGNVNAQKTQSLWTLQTEHLQLKDDCLIINCLYQAETYYKKITLSRLEVNGFRLLLNQGDTYVFAAIKRIVQLYLKTKFSLDLRTARRAAITCFFWKLLENSHKMSLPEEQVYGRWISSI